MDILGVSSAGGPGAACLLREGRILAAAREDRFGRGGPFPPREAISYCLRAGKIGPAQVHAAALADSDPARYRDSRRRTPFSLRALREWFSGNEPDPLREELDPGVPVHRVEATLAHAAAAYHPSPFDEAAILVLAADRVELATGREGKVELDRSEPARGRDATDPSGLAQWAREQTGLPLLALAGPLAADRRLVSSIVRAGLFERVWVHPAAAGGADAIGAALELWYAQGGSPRTSAPPGASRPLGPGYNSHLIRTFLRSQGISAEETPRDDLAPRVAALLAEGRTVGWFEGRLELADEPLASRSILERAPAGARARDPGDVLVVTAERSRDVFELPASEPPAILSARLRNEWTSVLGDGTASELAVHVVERAPSRPLHDLLGVFEARTGHPALAARPLRVPGEPVTCAPGDAYRVFRDLPLDAIAMGPYLLFAGEAPDPDSGAPLTGGGRSRDIG